jgi:hypothetical protein
MSTALKPGMDVVFTGLSEPIMTIVGIDNVKNVAICRYFDDLLQDDILLECTPESLNPVPGENQETKSKATSA